MADDLYTDLVWLPNAPPDFRRLCRALATNDAPAGRAVRKLATHALGENHLRALASAIEELRAAGVSLEPLTPFVLGVVGNATLAYVAPALVASAARYGIALTCVVAEYGQTMQEALDPGGRINRSQPDAVLLAIDHRGFPDGTDPIDFLHAARTAFHRNGVGATIVQTVAVPPETRFGSLDAAIGGTARETWAAFNRTLIEGISESGDVLFDVAALAETVGLARWHSPKQWNLGKLPFDNRYLPLYADHVGRLVGAMRGKSRRCLVLDLDNTLWGGVIGDDGIGGIVLGQGDATGEAFLAVQQTALALRERGIVLAVSSKNDDAVARSAFRLHPDMLLREEQIAVFQANWNDKAQNIAAIADELALGLESLVFVDDNPVERDRVRSVLPDVAVPELPADPALFARTIAAAGYFEAITFSAEDRSRADAYSANAQRVALRDETSDLDSYLRSLEMRIVFAPFDATGRQRIAQLINKSNQFNLTTRRYDAHEIAALEQDPAAFTLQVRLVDKFGDNGMICVVICRERGSAWEIDTWLMSCRVLGRGVEAAVLGELLRHARARDVDRLIGVYLPTERNAMVRDHYRTLGFVHAGDDPRGGTRWEARTDLRTPEPPMVVERAAFESATFARANVL